MRLLSYLLREIKLVCVFLSTYLLRRGVGLWRRSDGGGRISGAQRAVHHGRDGSNGLRIFMHGGGLGGQADRKEFTGIGRYVDELVSGLLCLRPDFSFRLYTEGVYPRPDIGERYTNVPCRKRTGFGARLAWDIAEGGADILHITAPECYLSHLLPALFAPVVVLTVHDVTPIVWPGYCPAWQRALYRSLLRWACRHFDAVLVNSDYTRRDLQRVTGLDCERVSVTWLGVDRRFAPLADPELLRRLRAKYSLPERFVLTVGRSAPHKNLPALVHAMRRLRENESDVALVIVGPNDHRDGARDLERAICAVEGAGWVHWLGYLDDADLPALYNAAQAFAFPSLYEGFGLPLLEAMACGTPVVCSASAALPEVADEAALLVDATDRDALAGALQRVLTDPALRDSLRERGWKRARLFRWEETARTTLQAYERAWERRAAHRQGKPS